jgi:SanA protein
MKGVMKWMRMGLIALALILLFLIICNIWVNNSTKALIYDDISQLPAKNAGLVLGTSKYLKGGYINLFFRYRMEAAARLYHSGKVKFLILSGDNSTETYNEPAQMKKDLMELGVPEEALTLDYAGLRTFDSMLRCRDVFNQDDIIIVSQAFHDARAIFICQHYKIQAIGFAAQDVPEKYAFKTYLREYFARSKMILDLYLLNTTPKYSK